MHDVVAIEIATGAASNIIAHMVNNQLDALCAQVARIFRHGTEQERSAAIRAVEGDAVALTQGKASEADLIKQWSNSLLSYLTAHPEARGDIESFRSSPVTSKTINIGSQNIYGSVAFGGDNNGIINFNA